MSAVPCVWCKNAEPNMEVPCSCHRLECSCQSCVNGRTWAYLNAGPRYWDDEGDAGDAEVFGRAPAPKTRGEI